MNENNGKDQEKMDVKSEIEALKEQLRSKPSMRIVEDAPFTDSLKAGLGTGIAIVGTLAVGYVALRSAKALCDVMFGSEDAVTAE